MKLIKPSFEIYEQGPGLEGIYEAIERAGRTCYKSSPKTEEVATLDLSSLPEGITIDMLPVFKEHPEEFKKKAEELNLKVNYSIVNTSAKGFVDRMIASQHYAILEHGTIYLKIPHADIQGKAWVTFFFFNNPYSKVNSGKDCFYVTTNYRAYIEHYKEFNDPRRTVDLFQFLCEPTEFHEKRVTVRFTTDRGVSHEFVRHRVFSFAQESTRYCNYSKDKFGNELTFIIPSWVDTIEPGTYEKDHKFPPMWGHDHWMESIWFYNMARCEEDYITMVKEYLTPQQARQVLPNALKTELVMTGFVSDWEHFFDLRSRGTTGAPHPDAKALAEPLMQEFIKRNFITE